MRIRDGHIAVMQVQVNLFAVVMRVVVDVVDAAGVEGAGAADNAVDFISFGRAAAQPGKNHPGR